MIESPTSSAAPPGRDQPDGEQRRSEPRDSLKRWIDLVVLGDAGEPVAHERFPTFNLSRGGVGLLADQGLEPGQKVLLCLSGRRGGGDDRVCRSGVVRHCTESGVRGFFALGIEFTNEPELVATFDWASIGVGS